MFRSLTRNGGTRHLPPPRSVPRYATSAFAEGRVHEGANLLWLRCQATAIAVSSQRASCEPLSAVAEREDIILISRHPAPSLQPAAVTAPADTTFIAHRHSTNAAVILEVSARYKDGSSALGASVINKLIVNDSVA